LGPLSCLAARLVGALFAPGGNRGRLSILIYHRVLPQPDPLYGDEVDRASFDWQMGLLARCFNVLALDEALARLGSGALPARAVCITFDDGYRDNHDVALPVLAKWRLPATFFVATGYLDGGCMWNDAIRESVRAARQDQLDLTASGFGRHDLRDANARRQLARNLIQRLKHLEPGMRQDLVARVVEAAGIRVPGDLMMRSEHVRKLHDAGMTIGAHTATHPILARVSASVARQEISSGREALEAIIGRRVAFFAYPNGVPEVDYTSAHVELVRGLGFAAALTTAWGVATRRSSLFELPRFTPWDETPVRFAARLFQNCLRVNPVVAQAAA